MKKQPPTPDEFKTERETEKLLVEYLRSTGKVIPQTPEEVALAEDYIATESGEAPERLRKCTVACGAPAKMLKFPVPSASTEAVQHLARAAREGKQISDNVEAQMRHDREKAKREAEGDK